MTPTVNTPAMDTRERLSYIESVGTFYGRDELVEARADWKAAGKTVVFTNGCYDLLHPGHIRLLEKARSLGDILILALNSDAGVRRMKGPARPLINERERAELALALEAVEAIPGAHVPSEWDIHWRLLRDLGSG